MKRFNVMKKFTAITLSALMLFGSVSAGVFSNTATVKADTTKNIVEALNDPSTSNIEDSFIQSTSDRGKIMADKTVLYNQDEYSAYTVYADDQFSVTLSAMAQGYEATREIAGTGYKQIHSDVVFVLDISGSMQQEYMAGSDSVTRYEAACLALNKAINNLMENDPETRFAIVVYNNQWRREGVTNYDWNGSSNGAANDTGLYLPLNNYTLKYEGDTQYVVFNKTRVDGSITVPDYDVTDTLEVIDDNTHWIYPAEETHSDEEDTTKARISLNKNGNYVFYAANSSTPIKGGKLEDGKYVFSEELNVALLRNGKKYSVYNDVQGTTTITDAKITEEFTGLTSTQNTNKNSITIGGKTFYVYRQSNYGNYTLYVSEESSRNAANIATLTSSSPTYTYTNTSTNQSYTFTRTGNSSMRVTVPVISSTTVSNVEDTRTQMTLGSQTFYIARSGSGSSRTFSVYTTLDGTTAACSFSAVTAGASASTTQNGVTYTFTRESDTSVTGSFQTTNTASNSDLYTEKTTVTAGGQTFYVDRSGYDGDWKLNVYTQNTTGANPVVSLPVGSSMSQTYTIGGVPFTFTAVDKNTLSYSYPQSDSAEASITEPRKQLTINGTTFYVERIGNRSGLYTFNIYTSADANSTVAQVDASTSGATANYTTGGTTYYFKQTSEESLQAYYLAQVPAVSSAQATGVNSNTKQSVTIDGQTFYVSRSGYSVNRTFNVYTSESNSASAVTTFSASTSGSSTTYTMNGITYTFTRDSNSSLTVSTDVASVTNIGTSTSSRTNKNVDGQNFYFYQTSSGSGNNRTYTLHISSTSNGSDIASVTWSSNRGSSATWENNGSTYEFTATANNAVQVKKYTQNSVSLSGLTNPRTEITLPNGQKFYLGRTTQNGATNFQVFLSDSGYSSASTTFSATSAGAQGSVTVDGIEYVFTQTSRTSVTVSYESGSAGQAVSGTVEDLYPTLTSIKLANNKMFYIERSSASKVFNIYATKSILNAPILTLNAAQAGSVTYTDDGITYTFTRTGATGLSITYADVTQKTVENVTNPQVHQAVMDNGKIFYITRTGSGTNLTFNIFNSADVSGTPVKTLSASTNNASTTYTTNGVTYTFTRNANNKLTITYPETAEEYSIDTKQMAYAVDGDMPNTTYGGSSYTSDAGDIGIISASELLMVPDTTSQDPDARKLYYDPATDGTFKNYSEARCGTFSQSGIYEAGEILKAANDVTDRVGVIVWISDGLPTYYDNNYNSVDLSTSNPSGPGSSTSNRTALRTIQTAIEAKKKAATNYTDGGALFYSIGPGVNELRGQAILDPSDEYMEKCKNSGTETSNLNLDSTLTARSLYDTLMNNLTQEQLDYVDFADWSLSGEITTDEMQGAMSHIVTELHNIFRPISTREITTEAGEIFDGTKVQFHDTIGDYMTVESAPVLVVNENTYAAVNKGTVAGVTTYSYTGTVFNEVSKKNYDLSNITVKVTKPSSGRTTVDWEIPADYIPVTIEEKYNDQIIYTDASPIRLVYQVGIDGDADPLGGTYYVSPEDEPATVSLSISEGNPYYYDSNDSTLVVYESTETAKTSNTTSTLSYSTEASASDQGLLSMTLGNNGLLRIDSKSINPDVVVIDYGLPVDINVLANDTAEGLSGTITGIATSVEKGTELNTNYYATSMLTGTKVTTAGSDLTLTYGKASFNNAGVITYKPSSMAMKKADVIYYEFKTTSKGETVYMYSTASVVPATVMFYEDNFVTFTNTTKNTWQSVAGDSVKQAQDRPGTSDIEAVLDANNVYGYDAANLDYDTYSLGSVHYVEVKDGDYAANSNKWPTATFTFTGSAFDIISMTSSATGTILVNVYKGDTATGTAYKNWIVDTFYGFTKQQNGYMKHEWTYSDGQWHVHNTIVEAPDEIPESQKLPANAAAIDTTKTYVTYEKNFEWTSTPSSVDNALYQIPVMRSPKLGFDTYTVVITPAYSSFFDHHYTVDGNGKKTYAGKYSFYLDAIRIYEPAEDMDDYSKTYYTQDQEGWPQFINLKENIINASENGDGSINGVCFVDSVANASSLEDYKLYGPNNELYLSPGQSMAFALSAADNGKTVDKVQIGAKWLSGEEATITTTTGEEENQEVHEHTVASTTDMYYTVCENLKWEDGVSELITIQNTSDAGVQVSLTNIKITYKETPVLMMKAVYTPKLKAAARKINNEIFMESISECVHRFDSTITTAPTYETVGIRTFTCKDCGYSYTEVIDALEKPAEIVEEKTAVDENTIDTSIFEEKRVSAFDQMYADLESSIAQNDKSSEAEKSSLEELFNEAYVNGASLSDEDVADIADGILSGELVLDEAETAWYIELINSIGDFFRTIWESIVSFFGGNAA